mmetsp:Transcript_83/g.143  ORF Transcript_83/g.143 Transcript_83/m.143 type:complete len:138 (-) Transcript_83:149-562(-)
MITHTIDGENDNTDFIGTSLINANDPKLTENPKKFAKRDKNILIFSGKYARSALLFITEALKKSIAIAKVNTKKTNCKMLFLNNPEKINKTDAKMPTYSVIIILIVTHPKESVIDPKKGNITEVNTKVTKLDAKKMV